ncbi:hypothetical protein F9279_01985 [Bacillus sp. B1-b2]|nr:hypothetical protein F9279_01985 [Bacillus sp. B1-b2]
MITILELIFQITAIILLLCSIYFYRYFIKVKRETKLSLGQNIIYVVTNIALFLCSASYLLLLLSK